MRALWTDWVPWGTLGWPSLDLYLKAAPLALATYIVIFGDAVQCLMQLGPTIAFETAQHVAGQAFAVQAHDRRRTIALANHQRDMVCRVGDRAIGDQFGILRR